MERRERTFCGRKGAVLVTVIALAGVLAVAVAAIVGYVGNATRQTAMAVGRDVCRLAAQSAIEVAKARIYAGFSATVSAQARVIGLGSGGSASSFDWFAAYSGEKAKRTIGARGPVVFQESVEINGCTVRVGVARVEHATGEQFADVTLVAEAVRENPGGTTSRAAIAETMHFAQQRSKVFNNAYFVNNYGWFEGTGCKANGDVRANGNMYLDSSCTINGRVYASRNEELGVDGNVENYGTMDKASTYRGTTYGTSNRARPLATDPTTGAAVAGGYEAPDRVTDAAKRERVKANQSQSVEMPYIGDISSETSDYRAWAQELHDHDPNMATIKQGGETLVSVYYDGTGPSGERYWKDADGNDVVGSDGEKVAAPDYGALVLEGTDSRPIEINGPVIVPNDVIIKGVVTGQGTIYSGRNIHIVGNVTYKNPPTWVNKAGNESNKNKDMLGLMAKGNIVLGNYSDSSWLPTINSYISSQPYVQQYVCDTSDAAVGYPATFGGSYAVAENVPGADFEAAKAAGLTYFVPGGYDAATGGFGKIRETTVELDTGHWEGPNWNRKWVADTETRISNEYNRKYYESVCADSVISSRASTITQIDAILYNNHGIFGKLGKCSINGSLVCRNEGISYTSNLYLNWDIRLFSGSNETVDNDRAGLAKGSDNAPMVVAWMEIPAGYATFGEEPAEEEEGD